MANIDLWLDSDDIASANASSGFLFTPPDDAVKRGNLADPADNKARADWPQTQLNITECKWYNGTTKDSNGVEYPCVVAEVVFQVPPNALRPDGSPDPNSGKSHRVWWRVVPGAMKKKDHPKFKANNFAIGKLSGCLRSIWGSAIFPPGSKVNYGDYFGGDRPAVIGSTVSVGMRQSKWNGETKDELTDFVPLELRG